jgi:hypothetical protein
MAYLRTKSTWEVFTDVLKDPERKSLVRIFFDLVILLFTYSEIPVHYFSRYMFKKRITNIKGYLPNKYSGKISVWFNDNKVKEILDNKLFFDFFYRQFNLSLPKILMYNNKKMFIVGNKNIEINNNHDFIALLKEIFNQNQSVDSIMIKKTCSSSSGKKIFKLFVNQINTDQEKVNEIYSEVVKSGFLFQETIKQHPDLTKLNPSCLNTIRIDSFTDKDGNIEILSAYLRMSISDSHIDNISSGGCQVGINLATGNLKKYGYSLIQTIGVKVLTEHPITKIVFEDYNIPLFQEVKELVLKTASLNPALRLIGWDVAIGESGPVLVEGNSDYDISGNDLADGGYFNNPTFKKVLLEIKNNKKGL